ncbi:uncharacterized protein LOC131321146 [Rhododendron vialii]|uniref:uncharacterized protein LOC131321146 n=1 Tax=Rhododendron vialii TaxID=182163 RepID=UPI00265E1C31|nr:uncharacterized protein LOC131321146 [Rhododendron vialii]
MARGDEDGVVGGGEGAEPIGQEVTVGATAVAAGGNGGGAGAEPSGGDATAGATMVAAAGDSGVAGGSSVAVAAGEGAEVAAVGGSGSGDGGSGSGGGGSGRPLTPYHGEVFSETPVLRTATVLEPRSGDSGIGSSRPVPFADGDFLKDAEPRDVLDAFGVDSGVAAVLRDTSTPEDRASALLLGALLSGAGSGTPKVVVPVVEELRGNRVDAEAAAEVRVTAVDEAKSYLEERPEFTPATYAPRLHLFEPVGMTAYVPGYADYPEDTLLRDRASHISS